MSDIISNVFFRPCTIPPTPPPPDQTNDVVITIDRKYFKATRVSRPNILCHYSLNLKLEKGIYQIEKNNRFLFYGRVYGIYVEFYRL